MNLPPAAQLLRHHLHGQGPALRRLAAWSVLESLPAFASGFLLAQAIGRPYIEVACRAYQAFPSPLVSLAKARDLAVFGAANWRGIPGLLIGGSLFTGGATHGQASTSSRVTLWDLHARWNPGRWDLSALYARGTISNTAALNTALVGNPTLIPKSFDGWYGQAAYRLWTSGDYVLSPFVRIERFNTARSFADLGPGLTPSAAPTEQVVTLGANFQVAQGIIVKADVQRFRENSDANRLNLGLGWSF